MNYNKLAVIFLLFVSCIIGKMGQRGYCAEFQINTSTICSKGSHALAYDGTNYLVIWNNNGNQNIFGQIVSPSGVLIGSEFQINSSLSSLGMAIAYDGTNYLVVWVNYGPLYPIGISGQLVSPSGELVGSEFQISTGNEFAFGYPAIAYDGTNYLVVWVKHEPNDYLSGYIAGQLISPSGSLVGSEFQITSDPRTPALAYDGTNYLVVWENIFGFNHNIYGQLVSQTGSLVGSEFQINTDCQPFTMDFAIAYDGTNYLVVWLNRIHQIEWCGISGQLVSPSGVLLGSEFQINIVPTTEMIYEQWSPAIVYSGINYLVTWFTFTWTSEGQLIEADVYGQLLSSSGSLIGSEFMINTNTMSRQTSPALAYDGTNYLVIWNSEEQDEDSFYLYGDFISSNSPVDNSLFKIIHFEFNHENSSFMLKWKGSISNPDLTKIFWCDSLNHSWYEAIINGDIKDNDGIRTWIDEGDNDSIYPRVSPSHVNSRFYKVVVE